MKSNILKGIFEYSISTWINFALGILSVIITTRILQPDIYGQIAIFYSISNVIMYMLTMGFDGAYIRFYNEPPGLDTRNQLLYKNIVYSSIICIIVGFVITYYYGDYFSNIIFGTGGRILIGLVFLYTFCNIILRYLNISFRMSFRVFQYNIQNIIINCSSKILVIFASIVFNDFVWIITVLTIGICAVLLTYIYNQKKEYIPYDKEQRINKSLSLVSYGEYIKYSLFSAPTYIVVYLNTYINQQLIRSILSSYELGIFSSTVMFGSILSAIKGGFSTFWSAYVYQNYIDDKNRIGQMHYYVMEFSIVMTSVLILCRDLIYLFIGLEYHSSKDFFSLLLALPILSFIMETTDKGIALAKKNYLSLINHFISVVLNIGLCLILMPIFNLKGAAIANAFSAIILFSLNTICGQKLYQTIDNISKSIYGFILLISLLIVPAVISDMIKISIYIFIINILSYILYKNECQSIFKRIFDHLQEKNRQ